MVIEHLFSSGLMQMGPSRIDPTRQVGIFNPEALAGLPALRSAKVEELRWIVGEWNYENRVPATRANPAYSDIGIGRYILCEKSNWICRIAADGRELPHITFDPFSRQWMYLLTNGAYGILRSPEGWLGNQIVFTGLMTMLGITCEWRIRWTKVTDDRCSFVNEEQNLDGTWAYIDEWRYWRT